MIQPKSRGSKNNRNAEKQLQKTLRAARLSQHACNLAQALAEIPNVGEDQDFVRHQSDRRSQQDL